MISSIQIKKATDWGGARSGGNGERVSHCRGTPGDLTRFGMLVGGSGANEDE